MIRRLRPKAVAAAVLVSTSLGGHTTPEPDRMPPTLFPLRFEWDVSRPDSQVRVDLGVSEYRVYELLMEFDIDGPVMARDPAKRQAVQAFVGSGQMVRVTLASADDPDPVVLEDRTTEEQDFLASGGTTVSRSIIDTPEGRTRTVDFIDKRGSVEKTRVYHQPPSRWIFTSTGSGVAIPVNVRLERIGPTRADVLATHVRTQGTIDGGRRRQIAAVALRPGTYQLEITTTEAHRLPEGMTSHLLLTYNPKVVPVDR